MLNNVEKDKTNVRLISRKYEFSENEIYLNGFVGVYFILKKPWLTLASIKLFYILMQTLHLTDLSEWASNGRKHNSFLLDI